MSNKRVASNQSEKKAKKQKGEGCVAEKHLESPSKLPQCKPGQVTPKQTVQGKIKVIDLDKINTLEERITLLEKNEAERAEHDNKHREDMKELKDRLDQLSTIATKYEEIRSIVNR